MNLDPSRYIGDRGNQRRVRGGQGNFSWDKIALDKDKEYYLGHSAKLADTWYTKSTSKNEKEKEELETEKRAIKEKEEELMMDALGLSKKKPDVSGSSNHRSSSLNEAQVSKMLERTKGPLPRDQSERSEGLGYGQLTSMVGEAAVDMLRPEGISSSDFDEKSNVRASTSHSSKKVVGPAMPPVRREIDSHSHSHSRDTDIDRDVHRHQHHHHHHHRHNHHSHRSSRDNSVHNHHRRHNHRRSHSHEDRNERGSEGSSSRSSHRSGDR